MTNKPNDEPKVSPGAMKDNLGMPLDEGIRHIVEVLRENDVETFESCEGGEGHAFAEPTVLFLGEYAEGFRAFAIAVQHGLPVYNLKRTYRVEESEPTLLKGPWWEMTFIAAQIATALTEKDKE